MSAVLRGKQANFQTLSIADLPDVLRIERAAYAHPWSDANFRDALIAGYQAQMVVAEGILPFNFPSHFHRKVQIKRQLLFFVSRLENLQILQN